MSSFGRGFFRFLVGVLCLEIDRVLGLVLEQSFHQSLANSSVLLGNGLDPAAVLTGKAPGFALLLSALLVHRLLASLVHHLTASVSRFVKASAFEVWSFQLEANE